MSTISALARLCFNHADRNGGQFPVRLIIDEPKARALAKDFFALQRSPNEATEKDVFDVIMSGAFMVAAVPVQVAEF